MVYLVPKGQKAFRVLRLLQTWPTCNQLIDQMSCQCNSQSDIQPNWDQCSVHVDRSTLNKASLPLSVYNVQHYIIHDLHFLQGLYNAHCLFFMPLTAPGPVPQRKAHYIALTILRPPLSFPPDFPSPFAPLPYFQSLCLLPPCSDVLSTLSGHSSK